MIQHFNNLQTPLKAIHAYPGLRDQEQRFSQAGWSTAIARSLWDVWNDSIFVSKSQRLALNDVEPFDEWEEFVLFASHYFLLIADRGPSLANPLSSEPLQEKASPNPMHDPRDKSITATSEALPKSNMRRFGALAQLSSDSVGHHGGLGPQSRIGTMDIYSLSESGSVGPPDADKIKPRMCHSITISGHGSLLIGGRTSPDHALQDCWLLHRNHWIRVEDLPTPLFRHCATEVVLEGAKDCSAVLAYGGKTRGNQVCNKWFLWREHGGWIEVIATEHELRPRFGAAMISTGKCTGILLGGMESDGTILDEFWEWTLLMDEKLPKMTLTKCEVLDIHRGQSSEVRSTRGQSVSRRMGACLTKSTMGILLIGGVASDVLAQGLEIVCLSRKSSDNPKVNSWHCTTIDCLIGGSRPLLVGHSAVALHDSVTVVGGGAVCFSFGTFWNTTVIALSVSEKRMIISSKASHQGRKPAADDTLSKKSTNHRKNAQDHPRHSDATSTDKVRLQSPEDFEKVLGRRRPVIIEIMGLGLCTATWTLDTLKAKIGGDRKVGLHFDDFVCLLTVAGGRARSYRCTDGLSTEEFPVHQKAFQCFR